MKRYVVGFFFTSKGVILIEKIKPDWQAGLYNGVGGHIEEGESPSQAMAREFQEETGLETIAEEWEFTADIWGKGKSCGEFHLKVFRMFGELEQLEFICDEGTSRLVLDMPSNMETSARWLCLMCADDTLHGASMKAVL